MLVAAGFMPPKSAPLIDNWFAANGIIMGKLALHELSEGGTSVGPTSNNLTSVLNPWNVLHHAGGKPVFLDVLGCLHGWTHRCVVTTLLVC